MSAPHGRDGCHAEEITVRVLGGGRDVGRSCFLLSAGDRNVLLDCGAHPGFVDERRFPDLASLPRLDGVLVTHFHLDHAGALPLLRRLQRSTLDPVPPVLLTAPTRKMSALMLRDAYDTSVALRQSLPFSAEDVRAALDAAVDISLNTPLVLPGAEDVTVTATHAGHVLGAVMFHISIKNFGSVVYSGDYTSTSDALLRGADVSPPARPVDLFITESTHCHASRTGPRASLEDDLASSVAATLAARGKVLIPVSALGRATELVAVLSPLFHRDAGVDLSHVPVLVASPLSERSNAIYDEFENEWCSPDDSIAARKEGCRATIPQLRELDRARDWDTVIRAEGPALVLATSGTLAGGVSLEVFRAWCGSARNLVVVPGYCFANAMAARRKAAADSGCTAGAVRCRVSNMSLSAHADARGIVRMVRRLEAGAVMLVHGEESKIVAFQPRLRRALDGAVPVYAPANGEVVKVRARARGAAFWGCSGCRVRDMRALATMAATLDSRWQSAVAHYLVGRGECLKDSSLGDKQDVPGCVWRDVHSSASALSTLHARLEPLADLVDTGHGLVYRGRVYVRADAQVEQLAIEWDATLSDACRAADEVLAAVNDVAAVDAT